MPYRAACLHPFFTPTAGAITDAGVSGLLLSPFLGINPLPLSARLVHHSSIFFADRLSCSIPYATPGKPWLAELNRPLGFNKITFSVDRNIPPFVGPRIRYPATLDSNSALQARAHRWIWRSRAVPRWCLHECLRSTVQSVRPKPSASRPPPYPVTVSVGRHQRVRAPSAAAVPLLQGEAKARAG